MTGDLLGRPRLRRRGEDRCWERAGRPFPSFPEAWGPSCCDQVPLPAGWEEVWVSWDWSRALPSFQPGRRNWSACLPGEGKDRIDPAKKAPRGEGGAEVESWMLGKVLRHLTPGRVVGGYFLIHERVALSLEIGRGTQRVFVGLWDCGKRPERKSTLTDY